MSEPTVCCVMLVNGREAMVRRAVASFLSQTYKHKVLRIFNTGPKGLQLEGNASCLIIEQQQFGSSTIGFLRNLVNEWSVGCDVIAHWDSDDWSHPNRLAEQVALLTASGADCVGYNQAVFWDEREVVMNAPGMLCNSMSMAWVYTSMVPKGILGASMLYWRAAWERKPFLDRMTGEDDRWLSGMKVCGVSAMEYRIIEDPPGVVRNVWEPRLIAGVHGGNTTKVNPCDGPREWRRAVELDAYCREKMQL